MGYEDASNRLYLSSPEDYSCAPWTNDDRVV